MGLGDFIEDDEDDNMSNVAQETDNAYKAYSDLDEELNPKVAEIVDEVIQEWNDDRAVDAYIHEEYVNIRRGQLVYGIVNIARRTQQFFDDE